MPEDTGQVNELRAGQAVYTSDGDQLGTVKELAVGQIGTGFFKVNAPMQADYWLQSEFVQSVTDDKVVMEFSKEDHGKYKVSDPTEAGTIPDSLDARMTGEAGTSTDVTDSTSRH